MKKLLLLIFSCLALHGYSQQTLQVYPDTFTVVQAQTDTFAVTANDSIPLGDSVYITQLSTSHFSVLGLSVVYHPDSLFTGRDTCGYVLCDTAMACDTAAIIVFVDTNKNLLPIANFKDDTLSNELIFSCQYNQGAAGGGAQFQLSNTSQNSDSVWWRIRCAWYGDFSSLDSVRYFNTDTISSSAYALWYNPYYRFQMLEVCITAYNEFGTNTHCDTTCLLYYEGISEVPLAHISIYPTPTSQTLIIDMQQNTDAISTTYTSIDIHNTLGQKVKTIAHRDNSKIINIPVAALPNGIYIATISDANVSQRMLGKFTVSK